MAGVHNVDAKYDKNEVTVKGFIDTKKIQGRLQKWSKKNVDIISETKSKVGSETHFLLDWNLFIYNLTSFIKMSYIKESIKTIKIKAYMHCEECEREVKRRLLKHKG